MSGCGAEFEAPFVAERSQTRQHFCIFLPLLFLSFPEGWAGNRNSSVTLQRGQACDVRGRCSGRSICRA